MTDPIRAALVRLVGAADRVAITDPMGAWWWLSDAIDAARAALDTHPTTDEPAVPPVEGEVGKLAEWLLAEADLRRNVLSTPTGLSLAQAARQADKLQAWATLLRQHATELAAWRSRAALVPVPVGERPWERQLGWCDLDGECWWCLPGGPPQWRMANPAMVYGGWLLPSWAIPSLPQEGGEVEG